MAVTEDTIKLVTIAAQAAADKLATDPVAIDVSERLPFSEVFLIASAPTDRQVRAIAENIQDDLRKNHQIQPQRIEGRAEGRWVLIDYGDLVCHILTDEDRGFYSLETLWGDQPRVDISIDEGAAPVNHALDGQSAPMSARDVAAGAVDGVAVADGGFQPGDGPAE